jgi:hypothetical protein
LYEKIWKLTFEFFVWNTVLNMMLMGRQIYLSCRRLNTSSALKAGSCSKKLVKNIAYREIPCALLDLYPHTIWVWDPDPHSKSRSRSWLGVQISLRS